MNDLELQRKSLPNEPGVYLFKDKRDKIIYVGKAIDLKKRVSSYFVKTTYNDPYYEDKIKQLVKEIHSIDYIVTENEKEAYILENIQIKKNLPRFNVFMRDSKSYPWVAIFYSEKFPRIRLLRNPDRYGKDNIYLGPYTDKKEITRILRDLRKIFPYCSCKKPVRKRKRPCLYYQLKLCPGPCYSDITRQEYLKNIRGIELFLKGETEDLKRQIEERMKESSERQDFESAAYWRDKLKAIESSTASQYVLLEREENKDIVGYYSDKENKVAAMVIIHIREGKIFNKSSFEFDLSKKLVKRDEILTSLLEQYYQEETRALPEDIIVSETYPDFKLLNQILEERKSGLLIRRPYNENEKGLLRIARKNAKVIVKQHIEMKDLRRREEDEIQEALEEAADLFDLPEIPRIIEGFDISNIEGKDATGSMVYFLEGKPYNKYYRHFKIRSKSTPDDVGMMKEVIRRRYSYLLDHNFELPNLILVDGGKGQLNGALSVLHDLGIEGIQVMGLAKRLEEIFIPEQQESILLPKNSSLLKLLQRVRDEAHRFAVRLQKKQRKRRVTGSVLDDIEGVGPKTRNKLLRHFGSVQGIKNASKEDLEKIVNSTLAQKIRQRLSK